MGKPRFLSSIHFHLKDNHVSLCYCLSKDYYLVSSGIQQPILSSTGTFTHRMHINSCEHTHNTLIKIINGNPLNTVPFRIKIPTHELGGRVWLTQTLGAQNFASYFIRKELDRIPNFPSLATTSLSHLQPSFAFCYHGGGHIPAKGHLASCACVCHVDLIPPHCSRTSLLPPPLSSCALQVLPVMFHPAQ